MAQVGDPRLHNYSRDQYLKYKEVARSFCNEIVSKWANKTGVSYNRIAIKDMKTRWGSCSSKSNLNFNYKIIFLNDAQADYLIVHEVSHLIELNHSSDFWALVEMQIPNYKKLRKEISKLI
jgi:predicted metal-dependent hydrolase